jgi:hypothetical protein
MTDRQENKYRFTLYGPPSVGKTAIWNTLQKSGSHKGVGPAPGETTTRLTFFWDKEETIEFMDLPGVDFASEIRNGVSDEATYADIVGFIDEQKEKEDSFSDAWCQEEMVLEEVTRSAAVLWIIDAGDMTPVFDENQQPCPGWDDKLWLLKKTVGDRAPIVPVLNNLFGEVNQKEDLQKFLRMNQMAICLPAYDAFRHAPENDIDLLQAVADSLRHYDDGKASKRLEHCVDELKNRVKIFKNAFVQLVSNYLANAVFTPYARPLKEFNQEGKLNDDAAQQHAEDQMKTDFTKWICQLETSLFDKLIKMSQIEEHPSIRPERNLELSEDDFSYERFPYSPLLHWIWLSSIWTRARVKQKTALRLAKRALSVAVQLYNRGKAMPKNVPIKVTENEDWLPITDLAMDISEQLKEITGDDIEVLFKDSDNAQLLTAATAEQINQITEFLNVFFQTAVNTHLGGTAPA